MKYLHWPNRLLPGVALGIALLLPAMTTGKAFATPSTLGFYPSTDIYNKGNFHYDVDSYGKGLRSDSSVTTGLTYGLGPEKDGVFGRTEIGFDYLLSLGGSAPGTLGIGTGKRLLFNAKTQLYNDDAKGTRLVLGAWGVGDKAIFAPNVGYLSASRAFSFGRVHVGAARSFAKKNTVATPDGNAERTNLHLGFDRFISSKVQFVVDYYSGKSSYSGIQPTLYYFINDKADFGVGYMRFNDSSVTPSRHQIYLCFDYNFGGGGSEDDRADDDSNEGKSEAAASVATPPTLKNQ